MRKTNSSTRSRLIRGGLASGAAVATVLALTAAPAFAEAKLTLSATSGPSAGGNTITMQAPSTGTAPFLASTPPQVQFQAITATVTACTPSFKAAAPVAGTATTVTAGVVTATNVVRINSSRIVVTVPSGVVLPTGNPTIRFNVCVYDTTNTTTSILLASAQYSIAPKPLITNITPTSGPALGGYQINVSGSGFTTGSTATLGGVPLSNVVVGTGGTSLSGTAPARPAGTALPLVITTSGGTVSGNDPDNDGTPGGSGNATFTLTNGIVIAPNTAPTGTIVDVDVQGVGFGGLTFADTDQTTSASTTAHVLLVSGAYVKATNRGKTVCEDVLVLADTELICRLDLTHTLDATTEDAVGTATNIGVGAYTLTVVANGDAIAADADVKATEITSGSTFTVAPY